MWQKVKAKVRQWFSDSETILWARLKVLIGAVVGLYSIVSENQTVNSAIQQIMEPKYLPYYLIAGGIFGELIRRHRAKDL